MIALAPLKLRNGVSVDCRPESAGSPAGGELRPSQRPPAADRHQPELPHCVPRSHQNRRVLGPEERNQKEPRGRKGSRPLTSTFFFLARATAFSVLMCVWNEQQHLWVQWARCVRGVVLCLCRPLSGITRSDPESLHCSWTVVPWTWTSMTRSLCWTSWAQRPSLWRVCTPWASRWDSKVSVVS